MLFLFYFIVVNIISSFLFSFNPAFCFYFFASLFVILWSFLRDSKMVSISATRFRYHFVLMISVNERKLMLGLISQLSMRLVAGNGYVDSRLEKDFCVMTGLMFNLVLKMALLFWSNILCSPQHVLFQILLLLKVI